MECIDVPHFRARAATMDNGTIRTNSTSHRVRGSIPKMADYLMPTGEIV